MWWILCCWHCFERSPLRPLILILCVNTEAEKLFPYCCPWFWTSQTPTPSLPIPKIVLIYRALVKFLLSSGQMSENVCREENEAFCEQPSVGSVGSTVGYPKWVLSLLKFTVCRVLSLFFKKPVWVLCKTGGPGDRDRHISCAVPAAAATAAMRCGMQT